jgi:hypothetical protein
MEESTSVPLLVFTAYNVMLTFIGYEVFAKTGWLNGTK